METFWSVVGLAVFLAVAFGIGFLVNKVKNAKFARAWAPLRPVIEGSAVVEDGGGAATSWLTGTYQGLPVVARMNPEKNLYSDDGGPRFNEFSVAVRDLKGEHDWTFEMRGKPEPGRSPWVVTAESTALAQRLERAGIESRLPGLGYPKITFRRQTGLLEYVVDVTPSLVPTPELFRQALDFLVWLAAAHRDAASAA